MTSNNASSASEFSIEEIVPHGHPMILIDRPLFADDEQMITEVTIRSDNLFFNSDQGGVPSWVGIEMMAQTVGAFAGFHEKQLGHPVKLGFLLGSRKYQATVPLFKEGETFKVCVKKLFQEDNGLGSFQCEMIQNEDIVATANVNVFSPESVDEFLKVKQ